MTCTNFQITSLQSSYTLPPVLSPALTPKNPTLHLQLSGISASCNGKYNAELISGNVLANVGGDAVLDLEVASAPLRGQINSNSTYRHSQDTDEELLFPTLAVLSKCSTTFSVTNLQFTGSISSKIIGLFSGVIKDKLTEGLNSNICRLVKKHTEQGIERGLNLVGRYVAGLVYDPQFNMGKNLQLNSPESIEQNGMQMEESVLTLDSKQQNLDLASPQTDKVRWDRDMPLLKWILTTGNNFLSHHINEGLILKALRKLSTWPASLDARDCKDCGFFFKGFNGLMKSITKGSGEIEVPLPESILNFHLNRTFAIPNYGNLTIVARQFKIGGLDNLTSLKVFQPKADNMLSSAISSDAGLNVTFVFDLTVIPANEGGFHAGLLNESFQVSFNTSGFNFTTESAVELDSEIYKRLSVGSFMFGSYTMFDSNKNALNCILEVLTSVVFTNMNARMNLDVLHVLPVQSLSEVVVKENNLEDDIDQMINNVMQMLLLQYPGTVTEALAAVVKTPVRSLLNEAFVKYIGESKKYPLHCANVNIPDKKVVRPLKLDTNGIIVLFNEIVNKDSTIDAINSFVECVYEVITSNNLLSGHFYNVSLGEYKLVFHDLQLENPDSMYELGLLHPEIDSYHLENKIGYGKRDNDGGYATLSFGMNILHNNMAVGNMVFHAHMLNFRLNAGSELKFDMNWLPQLKITDLLSHSQCISIPATEMSFYGFNARVDDLHMEINVVIGDGVSPGVSTSYITDNSTDLAILMSNFMTNGAKFLEEEMIKASYSLMNEGSNVCKTPVNPQRASVSERSTAYAGLWTFLIVLVFMIGNVWLFMRGFKAHTTGGSGMNDATTLPLPNDSNQDEQEKKTNEPEFTR